MGKYEKTITLEFESRQYTGIGCVFANAGSMKDVDAKIEALCEMEEWLEASFPQVNFRYVGSNLVYSFSENIVKFEIEPGSWIIKYKGDDLPTILSPQEYENMLKGYTKIG